jgi:predicted PurR-regulated permease PerM
MNSKKATLWFLGSLLLLVAAMATRIAWPFLRTIASALIVSVIFFPAYQWVLRHVRNRRGWASLIMTLGIVFLFLVPVVLILLKATNEAIAIAQRLSRLSAEQGGFTLFVMTLAEKPLHFIGRFADLSKFDIHAAITSNVQRLSFFVLSSGAAILGNLASFIANFFLMLVVVFFLFRDGENWAGSVGTMIPLSPAQTERLYRNITDTIIGNVYGIVSVGFVQGLFTGIAMAIVGLASPLLLSIAAFFASIIPVVGAALIWVPAGIYLLFTGALWKGVFVLLWGALVISAVDNIVRPWVVSGKVELHPLVLLFFILGGVEVFGFIGLFLGPVIAAVLVAVFDLLRTEMSPRPDAPS